MGGCWVQLTKFGIMLIYNMLRTIKPNYHPNLSDYTNLHLPNNMAELLVLYQNEETQFIRMCVLSKIKQIIIHHAIHQYQCNSSQYPYNSQTNAQNLSKKDQFQILEIDEKNPNTIFSALFLRFLKRGYRNRSIPKSELKLFYHVMSLAIKYLYNEDHFKFLFNEITELIQNHKERIQTALDFFIQVIATIEYNYEQSLEYDCSKHAKGSHCKFQRHFTTNHLNSMLMIANFFMEKAILRDNQAIQDGLMYDNFKIKATQEHIHSILELLHKVLCFDFIGEKYSDHQDHLELSSIIIPTKNTKYSNLSQFEKWLKNSDWIRIYQYIYHNSQMVQIKLMIIQLLGDMARIHMKYFKNKNCYRVHIENIIYALADILEQAEMITIKDALIRVAIAVGRNLLKLTSSAIIPIFFDINSNLFTGLLENIKTFIVDQIIIQEIFNANIIYYFFKFISNLHIRCIFQKNTTPFQMVEKTTRQICRNYQNYFRLLLKKIFKNGNHYQKDGHPQLRQDYSHLKQSFQNYDIEELSIYLSPFKFMKPRYTSANSVQQLFILTCAKFNRSIYIFSTLSHNIRERQFALQMIEKSILQTIEWFAFTAYSNRDANKEKIDQSQDKRNSRFTSKFQDNFELNMESISEEYGEQIQNQYQYCHMLRVICFFMVQCLNRVPIKMYKDLNKNNQVFKLINLSMILCFQSDLQQNQNQNRLNCSVRKIIQQKMQTCLQILQKLFVKQWQYHIFMLNKQTNMKIYSYKFQNEANEIQFAELLELSDQTVLLQTIRKIKNPFNKDSQTIAQYLKKIQYLLAYNIARQHKNQMAETVDIHSLEDCQYFIELLNSNTSLLILLQLQQSILSSFFAHLMAFFRSYKLKQFDKSQIVTYLKTLSCIVKLNLQQIQQQAINKMFLFLKQLVAFIKDSQPVLVKQADQLFDTLHEIDMEHIMKKKDLQFQYLHNDIQHILRTTEDKNINVFKSGSKHIKLSKKKQFLQSDTHNHNSQHQTKQPLSNSALQIKQVQFSNPQQIYNGYHRQMTMSILDKYTQNNQEQFMDVQPIPQFKQEINQEEETIFLTNQPAITDQSHSHQHIDNSSNIVESKAFGQSQNNGQLLQIDEQTNGVFKEENNWINNDVIDDYKMQQKFIKQRQSGQCDQTKINLTDGELDINGQQNQNL